MNIDDLESRVKDMTDAELDEYLRDIRARRKNTPEKVVKKAPAKKKASSKDKAELSDMLSKLDDEKRKVFEQTMKDLGL